MYVEIKTRRLLLRPLDIMDLDVVHEYSSDFETTRYLYNFPHYTIEETTQFLRKVTAEWKKESPDFYEFAVMLGYTQIGTVSVYLNKEHSEGELGWIIMSIYRGKGYAAEAAAALRDFCINKLFLKKLIAHCDRRNSASYRVMNKIGMVLEYDDGLRVYPKTGERARELMCSYTLKK